MFQDTLKTKHDIKDLLQFILDNYIASTCNYILTAYIIFITFVLTTELQLFYQKASKM